MKRAFITLLLTTFSLLSVTAQSDSTALLSGGIVDDISNLMRNKAQFDSTRATAMSLANEVSTLLGAKPKSDSTHTSAANLAIGISAWGTPVYGSLEFGAGKHLTVGAGGAYRSYKETYFGQKWRHVILGVWAFGAYHYGHMINAGPEWDFYLGGGISYSHWNATVTTSNGTTTETYDGLIDIGGVSVVVHAGLRYYFEKNIGFVIETSSSVPLGYVRAGFTAKW